MRRLLILSLVASLMIALPVAAQDPMTTPEPMAPMMASGTPMVRVHDQISYRSEVVIDAVYSAGPGWIVIHTDNNGAPGPIAGVAAVPAGMSGNVHVPVFGSDSTPPTPTLFAMLHEDTGAVGTYEFGSVEGADAPVAVDGQVVTPAFKFWAIAGWDQFLGEDNLLTIDAVTIDVPGFLVIHAGDAANFGPVLAHVPLQAGTTYDVQVEVPTDGRSEILWPMLHVDTGTAGAYEFGQVEGADGPVIVNGSVAATPIYTVPNMRVDSQIVLHGDNVPDAGASEAMPTIITAYSVLSEGPGFLVIHSDDGGSPGPVLGYAPVADGINRAVSVEISGDITPVVYPMLHVDTGTVGAYEFGQVEGADGPVRVMDAVLTYPINIAPSLSFADQAVTSHPGGGHLHIDEALIDAPGWLVIHSNVDGAPGPVLGQAYLGMGLNQHILVDIDPSGAGDQVFPMLHYDTGTAGVYEFGQVEGADPPVIYAGNVVVSPMAILPQ